MGDKEEKNMAACEIEKEATPQDKNTSARGAVTAGASRLSEKYEKHLKVIHEQLERAKDPSSYETYAAMDSEADPKLKIFTARRKGTKHVLEKIPCQDYCLATSVNGCTILADADGVSSCEHSDIGSKLACDAVVKTVERASQSCPDEDRLVQRLMSVSFRDKLVSAWVKLVTEEISKKNLQTPVERLKEFSKYGSTIMFAVITSNWIVVGNLGDGQILVFNECYGLKLRIHAPKESSRVRCLANERCAREDFQIEKYPRALFNGVLLSTDGMYESLDKGTHFYDYAIQMKQRFCDRPTPEPYQAFCYKESDEPYKDFSAMRTQDDCSVAFAVENSSKKSDYTKVEQCLLRHVQAVFLKRQNCSGMLFYTKYKDGYADAVVNDVDAVIENPLLKNAEMEETLETWRDDKYCYAVYKVAPGWTLEFMQCSGMLRINRTKPYESGQMILNLLVQLINLNKELSESGLVLNSSALFNLAFDGKTLYVKREALSKNEEGVNNAYTEIMDRCFSHVLGILECCENRQLLFDIGYIDRGIKYYMSSEYSDQELGQLVREGRAILIKNTSNYTWMIDDRKELCPGETVELKDNLSFSVLDEKKNRIQEYRYRLKESL